MQAVTAKPCIPARGQCVTPRSTAVHCSSQKPTKSSIKSRVASAVLAGIFCANPVSIPVGYAAGLTNADIESYGLGYQSLEQQNQKQKIADADSTFASSDTLKALLAKSAANKEKNKQAILNKYCYRQAELGIGDCGGLQLIPGMTKNGKQKTPEWLADLVGSKNPDVPSELEGVTLESLLGPQE